MKRILGLDLGTNSIGWSLVKVNYDFDRRGEALGEGEILGLGSRIIPMNEAELSDFGKGNSVSVTADRTAKRSARRLRQRFLLRRERLHRVLNIMNFLPQHYADAIDFELRLGQFKKGKEPKLAYKPGQGKPQFIFMESFQEMLEEFKKHQPDFFKTNGNEKPKLLPYDWTIYYLRKKALNHPLTKHELAWLILHFNQKRGYYQLRGDEVDKAKDPSKRVEFIEEKVVKVENSGEKNKRGLTLFNVYLENGMVYPKHSSKELNWEGKFKEFIVTTELNDDGTEKVGKDGGVKRSFKTVNSEEDWIAIKTKTEQNLEESGKKVGEFIFDNLLQNPNQKVKGKLIRTIERKFYLEELEEILNTQIELQADLFSNDLYEECVKHLYPNNLNHQKDLLAKGFKHLFLNDIIFYQRPLKSQKSTIANCKYEFREYTDPNSGERVKEWLKGIPKSHPLYQEFRVWEFIRNLRVFKREARVEGRLTTDLDVTHELLKSPEDFTKLFAWLNERKGIKQKSLLGFFKKDGKKLNDKEYRWNYVEEKDYPGNETRAGFLSLLKKQEGFDVKSHLTKELELELWHVLYSVVDKGELGKALEKVESKFNLNTGTLDDFNNYPPYSKDYGAFSSKALQKLLPLLRMGKYWSEQDIPKGLKERIYKIIDAEEDDSIQVLAREKAFDRRLDKIDKFQGLPLWLASYVVYGRHSEVSENQRWRSPSDIERLKQHSLRNPIVEKVINEALQVVKDIWLEFGKGEENFFDEIHVELGREMKNPADARKKMTDRLVENQKTNQRIRRILKELKNDPKIEGALREHSPSQQEILKIYEEGALTANDSIPDEIEKISRRADPSPSEIQKYKLWLDQKYVSPYTGNSISLSRLFTSEYEIEHVIPQSRFFDNSFANKVICEAEVNTLKGNQTGYEFIEKHGGDKPGAGQLVDCGQGRKVRVLSKTEYEDLIKRCFKGKKKEILLMPDIPESFSNRQLNDSRYISRVVMKLMSNLVREEEENEANSKHVIPVNGKVTGKLKNDWGLNDVWNDIISPRFQRLNEITGTEDFGHWDEKGGNKFFRNTVPEALKMNFDPKRIDHRHHALDALVVALADRRHVQYLNNESASKQDRFDLRKKLRLVESKEILDPKTKSNKTISIAKEFKKPWNGFTKETKNQLETTIVSIKKNQRIINKNVNHYEKWAKVNGQLKKVRVKQEKNENWWSIRRPLHLETVFGKVSLEKRKEASIKSALDNWQSITDKGLKSKIKSLIKKGYDLKDLKRYFKENPYKKEGVEVKKVEVRFIDDENPDAARRVSIDTSFNEKTIEGITDSGIRKILLNHLKSPKFQDVKDEKGKVIPPHEMAFSPEGVEDMNRNIQALNGGKPHKPIYKVRKFEALGRKFQVGQEGNKDTKYVVAATGTNLFFAIYEGENEKGEKLRQFETIPLNEVIQQLKDGFDPAPQKYIDKKGKEWNLAFTLSPNDIVFLPDTENVEEEIKNNKSGLTGKIHQFIDSSGTTANFIPINSAKVIFNLNRKDQQKVNLNYPIQNEFGVGSPQSKNQKSFSGEIIKKLCVKLVVNRLGVIEKFII